MKKNKILLFFLIVSFAFFCGFGKIVTLDTNANKVYYDTKANDIITLFEANAEMCKNKYDGDYLTIIGQIDSKKSNNKSIDITSIGVDGNAVITCTTTNSSYIDKIDGMNVGDTVKVYGKLIVSTFGSGSLKMSLDNITDTEADFVTGTSYSMFDGVREYHFDTTDFKEVSLADGKVNYIVPNSWEYITDNLDKDTFFYCNQYRLNELADNYSTTAESLFVFYFDNDGLVDLNKKGKTEKIEAAIIANIMGFDSKDWVDNFPYTEVKTYYDQDYDYYVSTFVSNTVSKSFHIEFVFTPVGKTDGICGMLYVYLEKNHLQDVLFLMRNLTVNGNW